MRICHGKSLQVVAMPLPDRYAPSLDPDLNPATPTRNPATPNPEPRPRTPHPDQSSGQATVAAMDDARALFAASMNGDFGASSWSTTVSGDSPFSICVAALSSASAPARSKAITSPWGFARLGGRHNAYLEAGGVA